MIDFYILLPERYCRITARTQADAQRRANKEFKGQWSITTDESLTKGKEEVEFSPIEISYGDYREEDLPQPRSGDRKKGKVTHTKIRNRNAQRPNEGSEETSKGNEDS